MKTIIKNQKEMRCGFTTGSCATAATVSALEYYFSGKKVSSVMIDLPSGNELEIEVIDNHLSGNKASSSVIKDAGDDPDVTNNIRITAIVTLTESGFVLYGGKGVGTVTKVGLKVGVGESAINPVPREMIEKNARKIMQKYQYDKGIDIEILAENGEEIAKNTFNPRLGIVGGISILGTSGIVKPMSEEALIDTIKLTIDRNKVTDGKNIIICPGNYGGYFAKYSMNIDLDSVVLYSNFLGETLDYLVYNSFENVLLVSHIGKLIKVAAGAMNTHSSTVDARMEVLASHSAVAGMEKEKVRKILFSTMTKEALEVIEESGLKEAIYESIRERIAYHINFRVKGKLKVEFICFDNDNNVLIKGHSMK